SLASARRQVHILLREIDDVGRRRDGWLLSGTTKHVVLDGQRSQHATSRAQSSRDQYGPMEPGRERSWIGVDGRRYPGQGWEYRDGKQAGGSGDIVVHGGCHTNLMFWRRRE